MNYIVGKNSNQIQMIALEQLVAPDSWARVIDLFVDILPIDELGFKHVKLQSEGRPSYNPVTLLELYLYGHEHSIRTIASSLYMSLLLIKYEVQKKEFYLAI